MSTRLISGIIFWLIQPNGLNDSSDFGILGALPSSIPTPFNQKNKIPQHISKMSLIVKAQSVGYKVQGGPLPLNTWNYNPCKWPYKWVTRVMTLDL